MAERPDRVSIPGILSEHASRLRALERTRPGFVPPKGDSFIDLWDDGVPQGLVRGLDFVGGGVQAQPTGDGRGIVSISSSDEGWDAIVDGSQTTDTTISPPIFAGIGEALTYLQGTVGLTNRSFVLVRPGTYTEAANWTNAQNVFLFGMGSAFDNSDTTWDHNNFSGTSNSDWLLENLHVRFGNTKTEGFAGVGTLSARNCTFILLNTATSFQLNDGDLTTFVNCGFDSMRKLGGRVYMSQCDVFLRNSDGANPQSVADTTFYAYGLAFCGSSGGAGARPWTLPARTVLYIIEGSNRWDTGGVATLTFQSASPTSLFIQNGGSSNSLSVTVTGTGTEVTLLGGFRNVTVSGPATVGNGGRPHIIEVQTAGTVDITGPAIVSIAQTGNNQITLRNGVDGIIRGRFAGSSGAWLNFVGLTYSSLNVGCLATGPTGTARPFAFDAASHDNVLCFQAVDEWPAAGTDAGSENRVLPEGSPPPAAGFAPADADYLVGTANGTLTSEIVVGPTPGGELGNTWAAPTVDATHSGSAHADFIAKAFLDAKGDLISATADNTPAIVTVGADGEVLTADSTDPAGVSWQPGGGSMTFGSPVESQFGNTGSDGIGTDAARDDHVHDRHDDGVLFFSGINH